MEHSPDHPRLNERMIELHGEYLTTCIRAVKLTLLEITIFSRPEKKRKLHSCFGQSQCWSRNENAGKKRRACRSLAISRIHCSRSSVIACLCHFAAEF